MERMSNEEEKSLRLVGKFDGRDIEGGQNGRQVEGEKIYSVYDATGLVEQALLSLARAETLTEIKAVNDKAMGIHGFAKQQKDCFSLQQAAASLRVRAQHKAGAILASIQRERGKRTDAGEETTEYQSVLEQEKIEIYTANQWQKIATIHEQTLIDFLAACIAAESEITTARVLDLLPQPAHSPSSGVRSSEKPAMKSRRVLLIDTAEMTIEEQDAIIWEAIGRAYLLSKKERMREELKALGQYSGYWLAYICAEYNAHNQLEGEEEQL